jgi:hypothetical protein
MEGFSPFSKSHSLLVPAVIIGNIGFGADSKRDRGLQYKEH